MPTHSNELHQARWHNERARIWSHWSNWVPLDEVALKAGRRGWPPYEPGAYVLRACGVVLRRMLGDDEHGVLDVGESRSLASRLYQLRACAMGNRRSGHMAGWRYAYLQLADRMPAHSLEVAWRVGADPYRLEAEVMKAYLDAFGELPPLNYKANWSLLSE